MTQTPDLTVGAAAPFAFFVGGRPGGKGSHPPGRGKLRNASVYGARWEELVAQEALVVRTTHGLWQPIAPPYALTLAFLWTPPATSTFGWPVTVDLDKLARASIDGLQTGRLLVDDCHVLRLTVTQDYGSPQGLAVTITSLASEYATRPAARRRTSTPTAARRPVRSGVRG